MSQTLMHTLTTLGVLALAASALSGCTPAPEPTPTAAFASEDEAFAAAEEVYRAYYDAFNSVDLSDPETFEPLFALSSGDFEAADKETLSELHAEELAFKGRMTVAKFEGLKSEPPYEVVIAVACVDVSQSDVVDAQGVSVASPTRPDMNPLRITFVSDGQLLLIDHAARDEEIACDSE